MKFSKYLMMAGAAAMLTACSSEEPFVGPGQNVDPTEIEGYAYFNLSMPSNGTRAAGDPTFADGDESEYKVKNGKVLIFGLPNGGDATTAAGRVQAKYIVDADFDFPADASTTDAQLDASATKVLAKIKKGTFTSSNYSHFYGVVILNYTSDWTPTPGSTFKDWAENTTLNGDLMDKDGYMVMTNAPLYAAGNPTVLSEINTDNVKDTEQELEKISVAATFYVQRVAAKVTLANATGTTVFTVGEGVYENSKVELKGWQMDLTRKTAYPVQNVWGANVVKFFAAGEADWFHSGSPARCHWADCKFYNGESENKMTASQCLANFNFIGNTPAVTMQDEEYIRPNTMAYNQMTKGQTSRMIIKAVFTPDGATTGSTLIKFKNTATLYTEESLKAAVETAAEKAGIDTPTVTINVGNAGGWKTFANVVNVADATAAQTSAIAEAMGIYDETASEVAVYLNGECYYPVYIRHFADAQEAKGVTVTPGLTVAIYDEEHTGRYGVVRNNWYDLTVTKISGPGMPSNPDPDPTKPVDELEDDATRYMNVDINILNWAKRTQNVEL